MFIIGWNTHKLTKDHKGTVTITSMQDFIVHANWKTGEVRSGSASTAIPVRPSGHSYYSWRLVNSTRGAQPNWPMLPMLVRLPSVLIRFVFSEYSCGIVVTNICKCIQYHGSIQNLVHQVCSSGCHSQSCHLFDPYNIIIHHITIDN